LATRKRAIVILTSAIARPARAPRRAVGQRRGSYGGFGGRAARCELTGQSFRIWRGGSPAAKPTQSSSFATALRRGWQAKFADQAINMVARRVAVELRLDVKRRW